jgi:hypothetical protein
MSVIYTKSSQICAYADDIVKITGSREKIIEIFHIFILCRGFISGIVVVIVVFLFCVGCLFCVL